MTILATFLMKALELPTRRALALIVIVSLSVGVLLAGDDQPPAPPPGGTGWLPSSSEGLPQPLVRAVRASPHAFFRLANRAWASRVCAAFVNDLRSLDQVRLHGDAHVEQYAVTDSEYGLDDFDDTAEGPPVIDIVRFLGSLRLAARERGWSGQFDRLAGAFLRGYQRGLTMPDDASTAIAGPKPRRRAVPLVVQRLRRRPVRSQTAFLRWADGLMKPVSPSVARATHQAFEMLAAHTAPGEARRPATYFRIKRLGRVDLGIGSRRLPKLLIRVEGPTAAPDDDLILEAKEPADLIGIDCLAPAKQSAAVRVISGTAQIGRLRHEVLSLVPSLLGDASSGHHWWIHDWTPSYLEVDIHSLASVAEMAELAQDAGLQLGAACLPLHGAAARERRQRESRAIAALDARLRQVTVRLTDDLLKGWEAFRRSTPKP